MSLFNSFAESHPLPPGKPYLWAMRLSSSEFEQLKGYIRENVVQGRFVCVRKECALYYAEWWRREYSGRYAENASKKKQICISVFGNDEWSDGFFRAAEEGGRLLGIQFITTRGEQREAENQMYSLLYQGGLPMQFIVNEIAANGARNNWNSFFKRLVWDDLDYDSIPGNKIASRSDSIHAFCDALRCAGGIWDAPFHLDCLSWWKIVERDFEEEKKSVKSRRPFVFKWSIELNENLRIAKLSFSLTGPQKLPSEFVSTHGLDESSSLLLAVHIEGSPYPLAEYSQNDGGFYSRRPIDRTFKYNLGEDIELYLNAGRDTSILLEHQSLDFSAPKILILTDRIRNVHTLGDIKKLSTMDCFVACSEDWECADLAYELYQAGEDRFKLIKTTPNDIPITLSSESGGRKTLNPENPLSRTVLDESRVLTLSVLSKERLFNAPTNVAFYECNADDNGQARVRNRNGRPVLYASKGSREWRDTPQFGLIRARIRRDDNEFVDPVQFYNVGDLDVTCLDSSRDECTLRIVWPHGRVSCESADEIEPGVWNICRERLEDPRYVPFTFHPARSLSFTVHFLVPYYGFQLYDYNGKKVGDRAIIPIANLEGFRYYIHPSEPIDIIPQAAGFRDRIRYRYFNSDNGKSTEIIKRIADLDLPNKIISIEGPLASLFMDGSEQIAELMDKQTKPLSDASVTIKVENDGPSWSFQLKDFPYRLDRMEGFVHLRPHPRMPAYTGELLALPFDVPELPPLQLPRSEETPEHYLIPEEILSSANHSWLIFGNIKGYVLPKALYLHDDNDDESPKMSRTEILSDLKTSLNESNLFSPPWKRALTWFDNIQRWMIPGSSVLELVAIADDADLLCKFALHLYLQHCASPEDLESLRPSLTDFQRQLYFIWGWAHFSETKTEEWLDKAWDEVTGYLRPFYITWVTREHNDEFMEYLTDERRMKECQGALISRFKEWMDGLVKLSTPKIKYQFADSNQNGGDDTLSLKAQQLFADIRDEMGRRAIRVDRMTPNELWKRERWFLAHKLCKEMNLGDLGEDEDVKTEIKKTTIFGLLFDPGHEV